MPDIVIKDLNDNSELSNEEMAELSGGYTNYIKIDCHKPKPSLSWNLSNISLLNLRGISTTLK